MNILSSVSKIMSTNLITLSPNSSIAEASKIFQENRIHHIPILSNQELVGIISKSDFLFFRKGFLNTEADEQLEKIRMNNYQVSYIMTTGMAKLESTSKINVALEIFKKNIFHAIPVVDNEKLVGIVTTFDIINHLANDKSAVAEYSV